jgi:uncharacterized protein (DUF488 family)
MADAKKPVDIFTIGFTKKGAEKFFSLLESADIQRLVDVRIRNRSQLSGFAKRDDLKYFLNEISDIEYKHNKKLAPTKELLDRYRDDSISWNTYEKKFEDLLRDREVEKSLDRREFEKNTVLLCSEHKPDQCHRRIVIEYLDEMWGNVNETHLID